MSWDIHLLLPLDVSTSDSCMLDPDLDLHNYPSDSQAFACMPRKVKVKGLVAPLCPTLCDPMDCSPPGSAVHGILQARILEWVAFPSPGDLPDPGVELGSLQADSLPSECVRVMQK